MKDTKENILSTALQLFAQKGYDAVSVSEISGALGITKGALYKHYKNKRDIFDSILARMAELDTHHAAQYALPEGTLSDAPAAYRDATLQCLVDFSRAQFRYWTQEDFPACFRRLLTLEQFRSAEMAQLYQQYLAGGPLGYVSDLFSSWGIPNAPQKALDFYAPMYLFYSLYDGSADKAAVTAAFDAQLNRFAEKWPSS